MSDVLVPNPTAPIGAFVRQHLPQILEYCRSNPEEFANLQDKTYCRATLRQSYPVLLARQSESKPPKYWSAAYSAPCFEEGFWVTSEWVAGLHTAHFLSYLVDKEITPAGVDEDTLIWAQETVDQFGTTGKAPGGPRYRATPVGVVQNALVRHLLGSLGFDAFTELGWQQVKEGDFGGACAYCGAIGKTTMDHAIPINRVHLGEHRLGNLVPACSRCNGAKSNRTHEEHLRSRFRDDPMQGQERMARLETHAAKHRYQPIEDLEGVRTLIEEVRARMKDLADEFRERINEQLAATRHEEFPGEEPEKSSSPR